MMAPVLHVVGLGLADADLLTLRSWKLLASGLPLRVREPGHEAAQTLLARGLPFEEAAGGPVEEQAAALVAWAKACGAAVYAVPGHPLEAPELAALVRLGPASGVEVAVEPALTEVDRLAASDPVTGTVAASAAMRGALAFARLVSVMARLRGPGGCPWDAEQDHTSLAIHLLEETHEVLDAIDRGDLAGLEEELGDLLLQLVFHAQMASEAGAFEIGDVVEDLTAKLVHRHPHVFGSVSVSGAGEVVANWEALKHEQKQRSSLGDGIPASLPALLYAHKVLRRLSGAGLGHPGSAERAGALAQAAGAAAPDPEGRAEADGVFGDLLYEISALALRAGVDPEGALRRAARRNLDAGDAAGRPLPR